MITDNRQPLVWPSLHSELSRMVATDECMLSHCCQIMLHEIPERYLRAVNETDWCHANHNMTLCKGDHPPRLPQSSCYGGFDVDGLRNCFVGYCVVWSFALATVLHARRWGGKVMNETACCQRDSSPGKGKYSEAKAATAKVAAAPVAPGTVSISVPAGASAGDKIQIQHEGASFDVTVPAGVAEGQEFVVALPSDPCAA